MTVEKYLQLKYGPNEGYLKTLRAGVFFMLALVLTGVIYNLSLGIWSLFHIFF
jgi:hypothetical protein